MDSTQHTELVQEQLIKKINELAELAGSIGNWPDFDDGVFFNKPSVKLQNPPIRTEYILKKSRGKRVLHFGFVDSPFTENRIKSGELLHLDLKKVTKELWGADIDKESIEAYRSITDDGNSWELDICKPILDLEAYNKNFDVIIFGEILEHLLNPGRALENLRELCEVNDAELIITTPNAFNSVGYLAALLGNEMVHPEHYYYYSPTTLRRLLTDCGFNKIELSFYSGTNTTRSPGITFPGLIASCKV